MKPVKKFFVYKYKFSVALLYLADMFINKLKTEFNIFFRMFLSTKRIRFPTIAKQMPSILGGGVPSGPRNPDPISGQKRPPLERKRDGSKSVKIHHFCAQLSHCFIHLSVHFPPLPTSSSVNNLITIIHQSGGG